MLKILHTADWHLGNFPAPASKTKQNLRYLDICSYIEYLINKAQEMKPDIIIVAGDIFNQAKTWSDRGLQETNTIVGYIDTLSKIAPVCVLRGTANHDGKMHYDLLATALNDNANVYIVDEPCVKNINNLAAIAFVPIYDKNQFRMESDTPLDKEAENNYFSDKVRDAILDLKKEADAYNLPTILVTHYTVLGSIMPNGQVNIFATTETVIDPVTLMQSDYWLTCLGHIHKPQQLETCPHAFYSGSLCGLSFNDENDPHGFYMHYINNKDDISSEFIEIPCRQFHTIWFDDDQLNDIISSNYELEKYIDTPMNGDIIRVIYTCTDATNKALNKALLEKALYETTNAFYVQEIIPKEIDITVDKSVMNSTASISDNLCTFLKNEQSEYGSISDNQINDCLQIAQPIIDNLMASRTNNRNVGLFTPIEIEVKNYRNYKNATFNYNDVKFCVINGDNGAGKSSLFMDAMLDALFEETREGEITGWINNDIDVRSGSIRFTFSIGSNIYKVTRTRQKSGKATLNLAQLVTDQSGNKAWSDLSEERIKDTQAAITRLIGMNAMTLKSCGLIMQDAYGLFLQADKNTRMDILANILNLDIYDELADAAASFSQNCQKELQRISDEESNITMNLKDGDEIQARLDEATKTANEYEHQHTLCNNELLTLTLNREALLKNADAYDRLVNDIRDMTDKQRKLSFEIEKQNSIIANAYAVAATETDYTNKLKRFEELSAQEKSMSEKSALIETLLAEKQRLEQDIKTAGEVITDTDTKIAVIIQKKSEIEHALSDADEIANNAALYEQTKREIEQTEEQLEKIKVLEDGRSEKEAQMSEINHAMANLKTEYDAKFDEIERKAKILEESGCPVVEEATCRFLVDARKAVDSKPAVVDEYNRKFYDYIKQYDTLKAEAERIAEGIVILRDNLPDINAKKQQLKTYETSAFKSASIPELKNVLASYNQQYNDFLQIKTSNLGRLNELTVRLHDLVNKTSEISAEIENYDRIKAEIAALGNLTEQGNNIAAAKATIVASDARIKELQSEIATLNGNIAVKTAERDAIQVDAPAISRMDADILACQTRQSLISKNISDNAKLIGKLELELKQYQNDLCMLTRLKQNKDRAAYAASNADWLKKAFTRNGIPHNIIRSIIPVLQTTASNILGQMSNNTMSIELKTEKLLTTKKEVATLDVIVCDTVTGDLPYLSRSGGERVKAALSVVLALAEIKSCETGTQLGFLFIDEPPFLDSNGIEAYCDALEAIQRRYSDLKIMAITHDPEMKSRFAQSIDVVKTSNGSEIYCCC